MKRQLLEPKNKQKLCLHSVFFTKTHSVSNKWGSSIAFLIKHLQSKFFDNFETYEVLLIMLTCLLASFTCVSFSCLGSIQQRCEKEMQGRDKTRSCSRLLQEPPLSLLHEMNLREDPTWWRRKNILRFTGRWRMRGSKSLHNESIHTVSIYVD